jgi:hypothetical protein
MREPMSPDWLRQEEEHDHRRIVRTGLARTSCWAMCARIAVVWTVVMAVYLLVQHISRGARRRFWHIRWVRGDMRTPTSSRECPLWARERLSDRIAGIDPYALAISRPASSRFSRQARENSPTRSGSGGTIAMF